MSPAILRLQHVALPFPGTTEAIAAARQFYVEVLGLDELPVPAILGAGVLWFAVGEQEVHLFGEPSGVAEKSQSRRHPCFEVRDLEDFRAHLDEQGVAPITADPAIPGRPRFFVLDPFSNAIEFIEPTAGR